MGAILGLRTAASDEVVYRDSGWGCGEGSGQGEICDFPLSFLVLSDF